MPELESTSLTPFTIGEISELGKKQLNEIAGITTKITSVATCGDLDQVGASLSKLLLQAKEYDPSHFAKGGGLFSWFAKTKQQLANHFATVDSQVTELIKEIDKQIAIFRQRVPDMERMYAANQQYYADLGDLIAKCNERIAVQQANPPEIDETDPYSAQKLNDWQTSIDYARKRVRDFETARILAAQQGPQIRMMQLNSASLAQKFDDISTTTISALKNSFALYIINMEQKKGVAFADAVDQATNDAIQANAKLIGQNTTAIQTSLYRNSITIETLELNQKALIDSISEVDRIRIETRKRLDDERPRLEQLGKDLAARLSQH